MTPHQPSPGVRFFVVHVRLDANVGALGVPFRVPAFCSCGVAQYETGNDLADYLRSVGLTVVQVEDRGIVADLQATERDYSITEQEARFANFVGNSFRVARAANRLWGKIQEQLRQAAGEQDRGPLQ